MGHRCCNKQKVKRGLWSPEEDDKLIKHITTHGHGSWSSVPKLAGLQRCGKSCRLRWINYLRPDLKKGTFTQEEEQIIIDVHRILGNRWAQIAKHLPGRTDNEVKNFWNSCIKKKLMSQGLDPQTHNLMSSHQTKIPNNKNITSFVISQNHHTKQPIRSSSIFSESSHEIIINSSSNSYPPNNILTLPNAQPTSISSFNYQYQNPSNSTSNSNSGSTITSTSAAAMNLKAQNPSQYDNITPNITTPNIASSSSSSVNVQNLSRPGLLDDFGIWGSSFEPFEAPRIISEGNQQSLPGQDHDPDHDDHQNQQLQDHEKEKIWEMEIDKVGNYSSFDLGFMESTLNISGVMCHDLTSMEYDLAWNY